MNGRSLYSGVLRSSNARAYTPGQQVITDPENGENDPIDDDETAPDGTSDDDDNDAERGEEGDDCGKGQRAAERFTERSVSNAPQAQPRIFRA